MGKMLDTLKRGENHLEDAAEHIIPLETAKPSMVNAAAPVGDNDGYLYIEVGGPGKKMEASPEILALMPSHPAHPVPAQKTAPAPQTAPATKEVGAAPPTLSPSGKVAASLGETPPLAIAFDHWPGPAAPRAVAAEIIAFHQPTHALSQQYQGLFGRLVEDLVPGEAAAWLLCGRAPHVGCTTVLTNLAVAGARINKYRLIAVDANLHRPALGLRLGLAAGPGVCEVLVGQVGLEQAVQATAVANLHVLPAGSSKIGRGLPWTAEAALWVLSWLRERFDLVLVDGPSLEEKADLAAWAPSCQSLFLVTPRGETAGIQQGSLPRAIARLGGKLRGVIETHLEG